MPLAIELASPDDYEHIGDLCVRAYLPSGLPSNHPYYDHLADAGERAEEAVLLVARMMGRLVGTVTYCPRGSSYREIAADDEGEFRMLAVDPGEQGGGVGQALVEACIERSRADGFHSVVLSSACWMTSAHRLYERLGFIRTPERDWSPRPGIDLKTYRIELA